MAKLRITKDGYYSFRCPCGLHSTEIPLGGKPNSFGARWIFSGTLEKPTFSPSLNIAWGKLADPKFEPPDDAKHWSGRCHSFVRDGKIQFLNDCTHDLAGQTVELLDIN